MEQVPTYVWGILVAGVIGLAFVIMRARKNKGKGGNIGGGTTPPKKQK